MTARAWVVAVGASVAAALAGGCTEAFVEPASPRDGFVTRPAPPRRLTSPYSPRILEPPSLPQKSAPGEFTQVGCHEARPDPDQHFSKGPPLPAVPDTPALPAQAAEVKPDGPPPKPDEPVAVALRHLLEERPDRAVAALRHYDQPNQDLLLGLLSLTARLARGSLTAAGPEAVANVIDQLNTLEQALVSQAPLAITKMCYCRKVIDFGVYDPLPAEHAFRAGEQEKEGEGFQVYAELANLACQPRQDWYDTQLASRLEICDQQGKVVFRKDEQARVYRSRSPRHDFFLHCCYAVPARLPPGSYVLWIQVEDLTTQPPRRARRPLEFYVTGANGPQARRPLEEQAANK